MSCLCGWVPAHLGAAGHAESVVAAMGRALTVHSGQSWAAFHLEGVTIGVIDHPSGDRDGEHSAQRAAEPAVAGVGRHYLWMAGEAYASDGWVEVESAEESRTLAFRQRLLSALLDHGPEAIARLDGAFQIALWNNEERRLTLLNDRFGSLPLYVGTSRDGLAFGGGVRGVLMAPGIDPAPDPEALREAVSFGGFRLADRTNVARVKMVAGGSTVVLQDGDLSQRRTVSWPNSSSLVGGGSPKDRDERIEQARELWRQAVARRIGGAEHPGQTLSGGLDSRAIMAEARAQGSAWTAVSYGVEGCDDALYARQAARTAGAEWKFVPLYEEKPPDWLDRRGVHIQATDGLIQLTDLLHMECLPVLRQLDLHLSGYLGDMVCGNTFDAVRDGASLLAAIPFSGSPLGWTLERALSWASDQLGQLAGTPGYFTMFDHKLPQAIHRIFQAYIPWMRVRTPFLDYQLFDFFSSFDGDTRIDLYHRMLRTSYPRLFAIPEQTTGLPILTPKWRVQAERARRLVSRKAQPWLSRIGVDLAPRVRSYFDEETHWRQPETRRRIEGVILAPDSLCCEILGREAVTTAVKVWLDQGVGPVQVLAALYVYEIYHRDLPTHLSARERG